MRQQVFTARQGQCRCRWPFQIEPPPRRQGLLGPIQKRLRIVQMFNHMAAKHRIKPAPAKLRRPIFKARDLYRLIIAGPRDWLQGVALECQIFPLRGRPGAKHDQAAIASPKVQQVGVAGERFHELRARMGPVQRLIEIANLSSGVRGLCSQSARAVGLWSGFSIFGVFDSPNSIASIEDATRKTPCHKECHKPCPARLSATLRRAISRETIDRTHAGHHHRKQILLTVGGGSAI